ncbi:P2Y purinoceptor 8 [Camelus dromedarius]|uniref:P2Y purinoceptor 8 n=1 Tax=Camelus dromedarius TaxID=9838 RepID=A0A5N4C1N1_CAMDR|nr:P2Y purinoceptor 8 [Camelus dromedarius]
MDMNMSRRTTPPPELRDPAIAVVCPSWTASWAYRSTRWPPWLAPPPLRRGLRRHVAAVLAALSPLARTDLTYTVHALGIVTCFDVLKSTIMPSVARGPSSSSRCSCALPHPFVVSGLIHGHILTLMRTPSTRRARARGGAPWGGRVVLLAFVNCFAPQQLRAARAHGQPPVPGPQYYQVYKLTLA